MKRFIQKIFRQLGYDLFKRDARNHEVYCRRALLEKSDGVTVLDVGANCGQFASELREAGFGGKIVSFEPLSSAHAKLKAESSADSDWTVAERCAIGSETGEVEINISGNSVSSSILPLEQCHLDVAPESAYVGKESVQVKRLDDAAKDCVPDGTNYYLKVDTQGFEKHVLDGAPAVLDSSVAVELELSLTSTYQGCLLFADGMDYMRERGFRLYSSYRVLQDRTTGELLQVNAFFVRD